MIRTIFLLSVLFFALTEKVQAADEFPKRKAGLWELKVSTDGGGGEHTSKQCVDEQTDAKLQNMASQMGQCSAPKIIHEGDAYISESDCNMGNMKVHSKSVFKGDFSSSYQGDVTTTYDPPMMGKRESSTKINVRWLGPCEAGQQPGDMIMPGGMKMNLNSMGKMAHSK